jgi:hypothetical protein
MAVTALFSVPSQVETIGALAGLAAIFGLAVLSMLYFAQARELKRLREWAGRAPERSVEAQQQRPVAPVPQRRVAAQPVPGQPARPGAAQPATPAGQAAAAKPPVPGAAGAAAVAAGAAGAAAATPAGAAAAPGAVANGQGDVTTVAKPDAAKPGEGEQPTTAQPAARPGVPTPLPVPPAARIAPAPGAPVRPRPAQPLRGGPGGPSTTLPRGPLRDDGADDAGGGHRTRSIALIVGAVVLVLAAGVFAFTQLGGSDDGTATTSTPGKTTTTNQGNVLAPSATSTNKTATVPAKADTLVAVLNGTTVPGLARAVADRLETAGYKIGAVTNGPDQQRAATQVAYTPGNVKIARTVAKLINVGSDAVVPVDEVTQQTAGSDALVVVTVGSDQQR